MHACMHTFFDDDTLKGVFLEFFIFRIQEIEEEAVCIINFCYDMKNRYEFAVASVRKDFFYIHFLFAQFMHY